MEILRVAETIQTTRRDLLFVRLLRAGKFFFRISLVAVFLCGCGPKNYKVLSFFFDGVPLPVDEAGPSKDFNAKTAGGGTVKKGKPSSHGPYAAKLCNACHNVRGGAAGGSLVLPVQELCFKCHVFNTGLYVHGPIAAGGCLICHDPHGSANKFLLTSASESFCFHCHAQKDIELNKAHEKNQMDCTSCHAPHVSDRRYLLR